MNNTDTITSILGEDTEETEAILAAELNKKYLTFWSDEQLYGIPISHVEQIVQLQEITSIPEAPSYVVGIINLREFIIPVIDVRLRFCKCAKEYTERTCIIVTTINDKTIGFIVDGVNEVTDIEDTEISAPPKFSASPSAEYITGIRKSGKKVTLLLNVNKLLNEDEINCLNSLSDVTSIEL